MYDQPKKYEQKPLEGVIWMDEQTYKSKDGREFTVMKGKLMDEYGKMFYIDAYLNYTKNGKKLLSLKLKSVDEVDKLRGQRETSNPKPYNQGEEIPF